MCWVESMVEASVVDSAVRWVALKDAIRVVWMVVSLEHLKVDDSVASMAVYSAEQ